MNEDIYVFELGTPLDDGAIDAFERLGTVERPLSDLGLFKMDEPGFVLTGNADTGRVRLRIKTTSDETGIKERFESVLDTALTTAGTEHRS